MPRAQAYDRARTEFYHLRMKQDIERRIAVEEALAVGAKFGRSYLEISIELESQVLDEWREKAQEFLQLRRTRLAAAYSGGIEEDSTSRNGVGLPDAPIATDTSSSGNIGTTQLH